MGDATFFIKAYNIFAMKKKNDGSWYHFKQKDNYQEFLTRINYETSITFAYNRGFTIVTPLNSVPYRFHYHCTRTKYGKFIDEQIFLTGYRPYDEKVLCWELPLFLRIMSFYYVPFVRRILCLLTIGLIGFLFVKGFIL